MVPTIIYNVFKYSWIYWFLLSDKWMNEYFLNCCFDSSIKTLFLWWQRTELTKSAEMQSNRKNNTWSSLLVSWALIVLRPFSYTTSCFKVIKIIKLKQSSFTSWERLHMWKKASKTTRKIDLMLTTLLRSRMNPPGQHAHRIITC